MNRAMAALLPPAEASRANSEVQRKLLGLAS